MALERLNLPPRQTRDPVTGVRRAAVPGEPAHDLQLVSEYIDTVLAPAIESAQNATTGLSTDPIEVSG
jgi:hypothetical protein